MKQAFTLGGVSVANIGSALLFQWLLLKVLGPGVETDALFAGMTIPQLFATIISSSMTHVLVPIFAGEQLRAQRADAWTLVLYYGAFFIIAAFVLAITASIWAPATVLGFGNEAKQLTASFAMISVIGMVFTGINAVQTALAFAQGRYIWADTAPMIANLIALALLIWLLPRYGAVAAAWIAVLRLALQTILLFRSMGWPADINLKAPVVALAWQRLKPLILGSSYYKMDPLVDRFLLSSMVPGTLSLFYLAQQLYGAASQVVVKALATPAVTRLAVAVKDGDQRGFASTVKRTSVTITLVGLVVIAAIALVGQPIISALLETGNFDSEDSHLLWWLLILTSGQFVFGILGSLLSGAFYAQGDTKTPVWLGMISFTIGLVIKGVLFSMFGSIGVAISVSIYYMMSALFMVIALYRRVYFSNGRSDDTISVTSQP
jgi:putative peptidoglycan lipid II flippase